MVMAMADYLYKVIDRETGAILCEGSSRECSAVIGCEYTDVRRLALIKECKYNSKYSMYKVEWIGGGNRGGGHRKDVICCDCGVLMENVSVHRKRCPECARKHTLQQKRDRMRQLREDGLVANRKIKCTNKDGCEGCIYYRGDFEINKCCNYLLVKGERRPCPPGKDCTVKVERKGYREKKERSTDIS
jgi:hypothetical protein